MFAPIKPWRRWHRRVNLNERRYAVCSAVAATGVPSLVLARGHRIEQISEVPLVVADDLQTIKKTKEAVAALKATRAWYDVQKVYQSRRFRAGRGKMRNRRRIMKRGPLIIYNEDNGVRRAFRNVPGVSSICVTRINLLRLAPGGHLGRFCIWTESAFRRLDEIFGAIGHPSKSKATNAGVAYEPPRALMTNTDLQMLLHNENVQRALRPRRTQQTRRTQRKNPLKNLQTMLKLNPYAAVVKRAGILRERRQLRVKAQLLAKKNNLPKPERKHRQPLKKAAGAGKGKGKAKPTSGKASKVKA